MAAVDPLGQQKYWSKGLTYLFLNHGSTMVYWSEGLPIEGIFPLGGPPATLTDKSGQLGGKMIAAGVI